jgi:hypothetical protein
MNSHSIGLSINSGDVSLTAHRSQVRIDFAIFIYFSCLLDLYYMIYSIHLNPIILRYFQTTIRKSYPWVNLKPFPSLLQQTLKIPALFPRLPLLTDVFPVLNQYRQPKSAVSCVKIKMKESQSRNQLFVRCGRRKISCCHKIIDVARSI